MGKIFDPFNDRTSRDIRNSLSSALVRALNSHDRSIVQEVARQWLADTRDIAYQSYIHQCQEIYSSVLKEVETAGTTDPRLQAVILWNAKLFFEVHELLETIWHGTKGDERRALKGLIQAAGVFVHRARNHHKAAEGLARRATTNLQHASIYLDFIEDLGPLVASLKRRFAPPPMLKSKDRTGGP